MIKLQNKIYLFILILLIAVVSGCGGIKPTVFVHQEFNFSFVESVAVVPFENLSTDRGAGAQVTRLFINEIFASEVFDIIEPGEVDQALGKHSIVRTGDLTNAQIKEIGKDLGVQALFLGSVNESNYSRSGSGSITTVTIVSRLVEVETGATIWSATHTEGGQGFLANVFGSTDKSKSEVTRKCVKKIINTLLD